MQQAQVNLLADMGAQPATRMSGLVAATASTDRTPPTVSISTPAVNASIANGAAVTVSGTASDVAGVVTGVEVSARSFRAMYGLDFVILRYFNVYGPRMDVHGLYTEVLVRWMERIADGTSPLIFGDGLQTMDFVFTRDIARANLLAAASDITDGVYNIASGTETSLLGLAESLLAAMDSPLSVEHGPERAVNGVTRRLADTRAAEQDLGFVAEVPLEQGLRELVEWWSPLRAEIAAQRSVVAS